MNVGPTRDFTDTDRFYRSVYKEEKRLITYRCSTVEDTMRAGEKLAGHVQPNDCIVLTGDLGAGKTQFAKGFAAGIGVDDDVTSPTFTILIEYVGDELPLLHFDLYRLDDEEELTDIDFFGLLESGGVSLVEWGDKFPDSLPDERVEVRITIGDDEIRTVKLVGLGARGKEIESELAQTGESAN